MDPFGTSRKRPYRRTTCTIPGRGSKGLDCTVELMSEEELMCPDGCKKPTMIMFYSPGCPHCKRAMPSFKLAAAKAPKQFYTVDVTRKGGLWGRQYAPKGVPAIYFIGRDRQMVPYNGNRTAEDIVAFFNTSKNGKGSVVIQRGNRRGEPAGRAAQVAVAGPDLFDLLNLSEDESGSDSDY